jgi:hypothetical protein
MAIDLQVALRKKLEAKTFGDGFRFETVGDQIIFRYLQRKVVEKTSLGKPGEVIECEVLAGEKIDRATKEISPVKVGPASFFVGTHLKQLLDDDPPSRGDICRAGFVGIGRNNFHLFGYEVLERVTGNEP